MRNTCESVAQEPVRVLSISFPIEIFDVRHILGAIISVHLYANHCAQKVVVLQPVRGVMLN